MNALILVDIQNDFLPNGALAVPHGDEVVPVANRLIKQFKAAGDIVVATQDWHPKNHGSFASQHPGQQIGDTVTLAGAKQILWPDHCVQHTPGADFAPGLHTDAIDKVFYKGTDPQIDSYSGFFDNAIGNRRERLGTGLNQYLNELNIGTVYIMGLATDYCVKFTALDATALGLKTHVILEGCRGVELQPGDCERAIQEMKNANINLEENTNMNQIIEFYSTKDAYGCFSNFSAHPIHIDGETWPTTEHYFQAQKFEDNAYKTKIRKTNSPMIAARLGRSRKVKLRPDWETIKDDVMRKAVLKKFETHEDIQKILLDTGDQDIVEKTTNDYYWGCGTKGTGKNMLGKILTEVREQLKK